MNSPDRRSFLAGSAAAAITLGAPAIQARGASEKLSIGLIGTGNRGRTISSECVKAGHNIVATADCGQFRLAWINEQLEKAGQKEKPTAYSDYRKLLEHKGLDAVIIATPDHHHKENLLAAMDAGKHAYCEKPLSHTVEQGKEMVAAVRKAKKIVQVGNQRHSGDHWARAKEVVQSKDFGDLVWVKVWDCRNWIKRDPFAPPKDFGKEQIAGIDWSMFLGTAKKREFDATRYWAWRWFWDYAGGLMTDIGAHQLDIVQWLGGVELPKSVTANGGTYHFKHWETPDVIHGVWDYGKFVATFAVEFVNGYDGVGATFYGTKQTLHCDADAGGTIKLFDTIDKFVPTMKPKEEWKVENETPLHVRNWLAAVKDNKDPSSPIELGHKVITAAHMANVGHSLGERHEDTSYQRRDSRSESPTFRRHRMSDEAAFLAAIQANPADDTTRLVYADWLDENDQPQRASYLRLVAALARAGGDITDRPEGEALAALVPILSDDWRFATGSRFVVTLFSYGHTQKINMIKHLREVTGHGLGQAKTMSESLPCHVLDGLMFDRARDIARQLRKVPEAVVTVLPTEQERLPFAVSYEVVAGYTIWNQPHDRAGAERDARAALAGFLERALALTPTDAAERAQAELVVLYRDLTSGGAHDLARNLSKFLPPFGLSGGWSIGVFARHVATEAE